MEKRCLFITLIVLCSLNETIGQWTASDNNIYNTNSGNVGIGNNSPSTLLYVGNSMTEPTITVRNLGGSGGATYFMKDDVSGGEWKFKATLSGGFKIRDHANLMDVITIEPNSFANAIYIKTTDNIGLGTASPHISALLDMTSTTKGFLPPRMTQAQISAISSPAEGLLVFNLTTGCFDYYFGGIWKSFCGSSDADFQCGLNLTKNHLAGAVAPVAKTVTYETVNNIPGETSKCWITQNLGADHQATSVSDNTEASAGWYWQFNRQQGYKHNGSTRTPNTTWISSIEESSDWLAVNDPCALLLGAGWRLPTFTEWNNVYIAGPWSTWNGPWNSALKIHAAGFLLNTNGSLDDRGSHGYYWSSMQVNNYWSWILYFYSLDCDILSAYNAHGFTVRCLRD